MITEIITLLGSTCLSAGISIWKQKIEADKVKHVHLLASLGKLDEGFQMAREAGDDAFKFTRRVIALMLSFTVFVLPKLVAIFKPEIAVHVGYTELQQGFLFFSDDQDVTQWKSFTSGLVITPLDTHAASAILGFYFGWKKV